MAADDPGGGKESILGMTSTGLKLTTFSTQFKSNCPYVVAGGICKEAMTALVSYFLLAILVSFICSLLEAILLSVTHAHIALLRNEGRACGEILAGFKAKIDRPLSAILTLNTVANTVGAAGVGAQALQVFGSKWVALASAVLTLCILIFSEIIPKTLGAGHWKRIAPPAAYLIKFLITCTYPFVVFFEVLARFLNPKTPQAKVTREEVEVAADMGLDEGAILDREQRVIRNMLQLRSISVRKVMTPRRVLFALQQDETAERAFMRHSPLRYSRIPVYGRDLDDITGMVNRYRIHRAISKNMGERTLKEMLRPLTVIPENASVAAALDEFISKQQHLFLVVDEYGGTAGIITLEDAVETLLGVEIVDELDSVEDLQKYARQSWEKELREREGEDGEGEGNEAINGDEKKPVSS